MLQEIGERMGGPMPFKAYKWVTQDAAVGSFSPIASPSSRRRHRRRSRTRLSPTSPKSAPYPLDRNSRMAVEPPGFAGLGSLDFAREMAPTLAARGRRDGALNPQHTKRLLDGLGGPPVAALLPGPRPR